MPIVLAPNHRYAIVGKTGSGKTTLTVVLACLLIAPDDPLWEVWWLDSKRDPADQAMLRRWGFVTDYNLERHTCRRLLPLSPENGLIEWQANAYAARAIERRHVLVVHDEYKHQCLSPRREGPGIEDVHLRGRGLMVGQCGETQEPVEVPRRLLSQATHLFLMDLTYPRDIAYARTLYADYGRGHDNAQRVDRPPDPKGFYYAHIDGNARWRYFRHVREWHDTVERVPVKA